MHMRGFESKRYKPWWLHVLAIAVGGFACLCGERFGYGWGGSIAAAAGALVFPAIIYHRKNGSRERFWAAVTLLTIIQIPLVIAVRPLVEKFGFAVILAFAVTDCVFVALGITWVCSRENPD